MTINMTVSDSVETNQSKCYFAFRDQMLGPSQSTPASLQQLCAAELLIYSHESLWSLYGIPPFHLAARNFAILGRTVIESCIPSTTFPQVPSLRTGHGLVRLQRHST
jgi:hypothetical protein